MIAVKSATSLHKGGDDGLRKKGPAPSLRSSPSCPPENEKSAVKALFSELVGRAGYARGLALRVMLTHQPESLPAIQSNLHV